MHKLLERQLKRALGDINVANLTSGWRAFLEMVDKTYVHFDEDRALLDHSLDLSSREHGELTRHLQEEIKKKEAHMNETEKLRVLHEQEIAELKRQLNASSQ